jgi:methylenetetrahydrofolate dehydrogenase (NADP+)/methenyltetrahydrofolate cyclohydrolase
MTDIPDPRYLDGRAVQVRILEQVSQEIAAHHLEGKFGRLVSISIGDVEEVAVYIRN